MSKKKQAGNNGVASVVIIVGIVVLGFIGLLALGGSGQKDAASGGTSATLTDGKQVAQILVKDTSYEPAVIRLQKDVPTELTFVGRTYGCGSAIISRDFWSGVKYVEYGKELKVTFTPTKAGTFTYMCTMGMYRGQIVVN